MMIACGHKIKVSYSAVYKKSLKLCRLETYLSFYFYIFINKD